MRLVIQRVLEASVSVSEREVSKIGKGLLVLLGLTNGDTKSDAEKYARKLLKLRIWPSDDNEGGKKTWDKGVLDNEYEILIVSQFTLYAVLNGNKPDFHKAMNAEEANNLYSYFLEFLKKEYNPDKVKGGAFQQYMAVSLKNDGPVTIVIDAEPSKHEKPANKNPQRIKNPEESKLNHNEKRVKGTKKKEENSNKPNITPKDNVNHIKKEEQKEEKEEEKINFS